MLHEHRDAIAELRQKDAHFAKVFDKHNDLANWKKTNGHWPASLLLVVAKGRYQENNWPALQ